MKTLTSLAITLVLAVSASAGTVNFVNTGSTLISVEGVPMPPATNSLFYFAVFQAPPETVTEAGQFASFWTDPLFQAVGAYNTNHPFASGRLVPQSGIEVGGIAGLPYDFLVRGWSANAGTTWEEAAANYNHGNPVIPMYVGESAVGNNIILGDNLIIPPLILFGTFESYQVRGFNMILVPEPSVVALTLLGLLGWRAWRRRLQQ